MSSGNVSCSAEQCLHTVEKWNCGFLLVSVTQWSTVKMQFCMCFVSDSDHPSSFSCWQRERGDLPLTFHASLYYIVAVGDICCQQRTCFFITLLSYLSFIISHFKTWRVSWTLWLLLLLLFLLSNWCRMQAYAFSNATVLWFYCARFKAVQRDVFIYICNFKLFTDKVNAYVTKHKSGFLYKKT